VAAILSPLGLYGGNRKMKLSLLHERKIHNPQGKYGQDLVFLIKRPRLLRSLRPSDAIPAIPPRVPWYRSFSTCSDPVSTRRVSRLGFVTQPSNMMVLWWTSTNPSCRLQLWAATLHRLSPRLGIAFLVTVQPALDPIRPMGPSSRAYLSLYSSEALQG
jgi:hypothetical protein